ncbi:MAG: hypothetical protein EP335_11405 [Alphaproteobacteria bacterium]|nr:MAG: hypothetical protein EP335_11405 [Alphaproteobacteria bacterium]
MKLKLEPNHIGFKLDRAEAEQLLAGQSLSAQLDLPGQAPLVWSVCAGFARDMKLEGLNLTVPRHLLAAELADRPSRAGLTAHTGHLVIAFQIDLRRERPVGREVRHA